MFSFLATTYLLPIIALNPSIVIHFINTIYSHFLPSAGSVSHSPYPWFERLGPVPGTSLLYDVHDHDQSLWVFTVMMVLLQVVVFEWVKENRAQMELARKANARKDVNSKYGNERIIGNGGNAYWKIIAFSTSCRRHLGFL
jgi:hypothetical protein